MRRVDAIRLAVGSMKSAGAWVRNKPFILNHLVTVRCNVACPFCYVSGPEQRDYNLEHYPKKGEMDTEETKTFYRQLLDEWFTLAVILGGEPLLRTDLDDLLGVMENRVWMTVFTNGYLLEDRHELIQRATNLFVSIDAPDEQHDELRGRVGTLSRALSGIEAVRRHHPSVKVTVNTTVTTGNVHRVREMIAFARELGVPISFQPPTYDGCFGLDDRPEDESSAHLPTADPVAEAFRCIRDAALGGERIVGSGDFFEQVIQNRPTFPCHYPGYVLGPVMPNGDVVGCVTSEVIGSVRETPVGEILRSDAFQQNAARGPGCERGCRDWGIYDLSALRNRRWRMGDAQRYRRAFLS